MEEIKLEFEITEQELTPGGDIPPAFGQKIYAHLADGGLIICPSDTCYSLAAMCSFADMGNTLNIILERQEMPFSVAVDGVVMATEYVQEENEVFYKLLEWFTPGPITCIAEIRKELTSFSKIIHAGKDDTVGIRISDSIIERTIARFVNCPITTVPAKIGTNPPTKNYDEACRNIINSVNTKIRDGKLKEPVKIAGIKIDDSFTNKLSTVIRIENVLKELQIVRPGYITENELNLFFIENQLSDWKIVNGEI
jgi:L-threonylcarbamoyladenylate synthase